jgi:hypothetical protein
LITSSAKPSIRENTFALAYKPKQSNYTFILDNILSRKIMRITHILMAIIFVFTVACSGGDKTGDHGHSHGKGGESHTHSEGDKNHSHEASTKHTQEEFKVNTDSTKTVKDSSKTTKDSTKSHTHKDGTKHHDHH